MFYKAKGDGLSEASTKPGIFAGWHMSPGMKYKGSLLVLDYEALRNRSHLYWVPKQIQAQEVYLPPTDRIEFPLARVAKQALLDMSDPEKEIAKSNYDRSVTEGVLPYDIGIDAFPVEDKPPPQRHAGQG